MKTIIVNRTVEIQVHEIMYLKGEGNYTHIFCSNGEKLIVSRTLKILEERIDDPSFIRINNNHVINLAFIVSCKKEGRKLSVFLGNDLNFDVSRRKTSTFRKELKIRHIKPIKEKSSSAN
ncbi:LytR/AlgR family response regulator transcription factor [Arcicella rigui]|uniref:LytTR family DNA-binding domain-containing protein n=1 Tax=Arcicella rigui TaxID=797020 RepID=A0ABU5Q8W3_9BACT|nr:LytTR family DNA-binding domain-containing protein [Arcicella rigui]MEA5139033.1 LytTR family DNA-binding domain-containing protein [Arcicella rigui]